MQTTISPEQTQEPCMLATGLCFRLRPDPEAAVGTLGKVTGPM